MELTKQQEKAVELIKQWLKGWKDTSSKPFFYLGGYAGTGKTTIEGLITQELSGRIVRAAYTGKAALRMQQLSGRQASTVHAIAYKIVEESSGSSDKSEPKFELDRITSPIIGASLVVLDECSFINEEMGEDLLEFKVPILVLGDPFQLPPPKGSGFFTKRTPDYMLTDVRRQALESPILRIATDIREGKTIGRSIEEGAKIYPFSKDFDYQQELLLADQILTGTNKVRRRVNMTMRELKGHVSESGMIPVVGDKLICLKNQRPLGLFNGLSAEVDLIRYHDEEVVVADLTTEIGPRKEVAMFNLCFSDPEAVEKVSYRERKAYSEFDYGYCITVHKSQGSQWSNLLILDDGFLNWKKEERAKWLYTAVTRAVDNLTILRQQ